MTLCAIHRRVTCTCATVWLPDEAVVERLKRDSVSEWLWCRLAGTQAARLRKVTVLDFARDWYAGGPIHGRP